LVSSPQDIVDVDVLISVVADDRAEMAVMFESGLIDRLPKDCVHMSSTTLGSIPRKNSRLLIASTGEFMWLRRSWDALSTWRRMASCS
jgi:3-hydroxyisobutyrate dehydrogenase-like beta-hydroxyacid dehydrogenase